MSSTENYWFMFTTVVCIDADDSNQFTNTTNTANICSHLKNLINLNKRKRVNIDLVCTVFVDTEGIIRIYLSSSIFLLSPI